MFIDSKDGSNLECATKQSPHVWHLIELLLLIYDSSKYLAKQLHNLYIMSTHLSTLAQVHTLLLTLSFLLTTDVFFEKKPKAQILLQSL